MFLGDAVFAIATTVLVLEIKVPALIDEQVEAGELARALVIWKSIVRSTSRLSWLNILLLLLVAFMPAPTAPGVSD